jgi:hypothetical protein
VYDLAQAGGAGDEIVRRVAEVVALVTDTACDVGTRRESETWSPLEYTCHLRDVLLVQRERVLEARRTDTPAFAPMGRDERVEHDGYDAQQPADVGRQLTDAAAMFANVLSRLDVHEWDRRVIYNFPTTMERPLRWVAVHTVHEAQHHLGDIRKQLP